MSTFRNNGPASEKYFQDANGVDTRFPLGDVVTASNYMKRYAGAEGVLGYELELVSDDGGEWNDDTNEASNVVRETSVSVAAASTYAANEVDVEDDLGLAAPIENITIDASADVRVRLNGDDSGTFLVEAGTSKTFTKDDGLLVSTLNFDRSMSGASGASTVRVTGVGAPAA